MPKDSKFVHLALHNAKKIAIFFTSIAINLAIYMINFLYLKSNILFL
jgi:hypothetical protein